jgi:hypothetical protein
MLLLGSRISGNKSIRTTKISGFAEWICTKNGVICRFYFSPLLTYEAIFRKALRVSIASESQTLSWQHTLNIAPIGIHHLHKNSMHLTLIVLSRRARAACRGTSTASAIPAVAVEPASPLRIVSNCTVNNYPGSGRTVRAGSPASSSAAAAPS